MLYLARRNYRGIVLDLAGPAAMMAAAAQSVAFVYYILLVPTIAQPRGRGSLFSGTTDMQQLDFIVVLKKSCTHLKLGYS